MAVIGFAVVTMVFTPLAFLAVLFPLNIDGFGKLQLKDREGVYSSSKLGAIFGTHMFTISILRRGCQDAVGSEVLTIILTAALVVVSVSNINRLDQGKEFEGGLARKDTIEAKTEQGASGSLANQEHAVER